MAIPAVTEAHDRAVKRTLAWVEKNIVETRMKDPETGAMGHAGGQKTVAATFRHDTSRNLDPQLHTHAVLANMVQGEDGKWRTMGNEKLYASKMLIGALYRGELAQELGKLGYGIEKTHADGRFEIAGVPRKVVEAFSTRRAEIEAAMVERGLGTPAENQRLAQRTALMTRKRYADKQALQESWQKKAAGLGFDVQALAAEGCVEGTRIAGTRQGNGAGRAGCAANQRRAGRLVGSGPSRRARGGVLAHGPARRQPAGAGRLAHHRKGNSQRAGNHCPDAGRSRTRTGPDARTRGRQGAEEGPTDGGAERGREADPVLERSRGRCAGAMPGPARPPC